MPEMNRGDVKGDMVPENPGFKPLFVSGYCHHGVFDHSAHFIQKPLAINFLGEELREALGGLQADVATAGAVS
jgi:hypothetical protein